MNKPTPQIPAAFIETVTPAGDLMQLTQDGSEIDVRVYPDNELRSTSIIDANTGAVLHNTERMATRQFEDQLGQKVVASEVEPGIIEATTHIISAEDAALDISGRHIQTIDKQTGKVLDEYKRAVPTIPF